MRYTVRLDGGRAVRYSNVTLSIPHKLKVKARKMNLSFSKVLIRALEGIIASEGSVVVCSSSVPSPTSATCQEAPANDS